MTRRLVIHGVLAATTVAVFLPVLGRGLMLYDVGELVFYTDKLLAGARPGTDFVVNAYGPGRYVLLGALWEVFGRSFNVIWGLFLVLRIVIAALSWELARRYVGEAWAMLPVACLWVAPGPLHKGLYLAGTLAIALALVLYLEAPGRRRAIALGLTLAFVAWFRLDVGAFGVIVTTLACVAVPERRADLAVAATPLAGGLLGTGLQLGLQGDGALGAVLGQLKADILVNQTIRYPRFPGVGDLFAFDRLDPWLMVLPLAVYGALFVLLARAVSWYGAGEEQRIRRRRVGALFLLGVLSLNQVRMKPEIGHLMQAGPLLWLSIALLLSRQDARARALGRPLRRRAVQALGMALPVVLAGHVLLEHRGDLYTGSFTIGEERTHRLATRLGPVWLNPGEHELLSGVIEALDGLPAGPLWVPTNQPLLYALAGREDISGFPTVLYFAQSRKRELQLLSRLKETPPPVVVFIDDTVQGPETLLATGAPLAHAYLFGTYEEVVRVGDASVMVREEFTRAP